MDVLKRMIASQKQINLMIGAGLTMFTNQAGFEPIVTQAVAGIFSILIAVQGILDYKHGSPSDATGEFKV